jgi:preprotein translocase subunit SecE
MKKVIDFVKESIEEMKSKVSWPKYSELQSSSLLVLVASLIFALLIGLIDFLFKNGVGAIYNNF